MEIAGERPSIESTSGFSICSRNCRAYADSDSTYLRCPTAKIVSKASDDFPEPETPVITTRRLRGTSQSRLRRLCWRAPRILRKSMKDPDCNQSSSNALAGDLDRLVYDFSRRHGLILEHYRLSRHSGFRTWGNWTTEGIGVAGTTLLVRPRENRRFRLG